MSALFSKIFVYQLLHFSKCLSIHSFILLFMGAPICATFELRIIVIFNFKLHTREDIIIHIKGYFLHFFHDAGKCLFFTNNFEEFPIEIIILNTILSGFGGGFIIELNNILWFISVCYKLCMLYV
jgi:hypothetical protein